MSIGFRFLLSFSIWIYFSTHLSGQSDDAIKLEKSVREFNDSFQYLSSFAAIDKFVSQTKDPFDHYYAYLLKSYTYKRLFNYEEALKCLDKAYLAGKKSDRQQEIASMLSAEKSFIYFDLHEYERASELMDSLRKTDYTFLSIESKSFVIMQEGYIYFLNKDYSNAELYLQSAKALMQENHPRNLPMVYGKLLELYNATNEYEKRDDAFNKGIDIAKVFGLLKYEMYMYEMLRKEHVYNREFEEAYLTGLILDSVSKLYDATNNNHQLINYNKNLELKEKEHEIQRFTTIRNFMMVILIIFLIVIVLSYQLIKSVKQEHLLLGNEYQRIYDELTLLAQKKEKGDQFDLSKYNLTTRQNEIIALLKEGKTNKQIASELFISENTVKYHIKSIYEILQIENRTQLFKFLNTSSI